MSKITLAPNASGTGTLTVAAPNTNSDYTLTLPAETGTVLTSASSITQNAGPAFSAYRTTTQAIPNSTYTQIQWDAENFDTDSCFNTGTYTFTPTVAGYYLLSANAYMGPFAATNMFLEFRKNNSRFGFTASSALSAGQYIYFAGSVLVYANGTTDYFTTYVYQDSGSSQNLSSGSGQTIFSGVLVRAA